MRTLATALAIALFSARLFAEPKFSISRLTRQTLNILGIGVAFPKLKGDYLQVWIEGKAPERQYIVSANCGDDKQSQVVERASGDVLTICWFDVPTGKECKVTVDDVTVRSSATVLSAANEVR